MDSAVTQAVLLASRIVFRGVVDPLAWAGSTAFGAHSANHGLIYHAKQERDEKMRRMWKLVAGQRGERGGRDG